jgi:integration host factor subunit alpha
MHDNESLPRAGIAAAVQREVGLNNRNSLKLVETILAHLCSAMERGENVKITGFGTFLLRDKGKRIGRNPKTGEEHAIAPRRVMTFRGSKKLKDLIMRADQEEPVDEVVRVGRG